MREVAARPLLRRVERELLELEDRLVPELLAMPSRQGADVCRVAFERLPAGRLLRFTS